MEVRGRSKVSWAIVVVASICVLVMIPMAIVTQDHFQSDYGEWIVGCFAPGFLVSGWWLVGRRPNLIVGQLFLVAGLTTAISGVSVAYAGTAAALQWRGSDWGLWVFSWMWQPHAAILTIVFVLFPDGTFRARWHRWFAWLITGALAFSMAWSMVRPGNIITTPDKPDGAVAGIVNPLGIEGVRSIVDVLAVLLLLTLFSQFVPILITASGWRRSEGTRRRQFRWATLIQISAIPIGILVFSLAEWAGPVAVVQTLVTQLLIAIAILQWQAYEVDVVVRRSVLATTFLVAGLGTYAAVVAIVAVVLGHTGTVPSAIGAAVAIFAFGPLSVRIQSAVNRVLYGRRDDPYAVVAELGRQLANSSDPSAGLQSLVTVLTEQLHLPYAEVLDPSLDSLAVSGTPERDDHPREIPLSHHGSPVGLLRVGHRRGTNGVTDSEEQLLDTLALQLGAAVHANHLVAGLREARERLVRTRHDERRRIQRDLHDGLGPQLTAVTLKLAAARNHLDVDGRNEAGELIVEAREELHRAVADVRRLVYSLGDPALAALGLDAALRDQITQLTRAAGLDVTIQIDTLPELSAAVESAMYRIVSEAVTNVVRHAAAQHCSVCIGRCGDNLKAEISDDGCGIGPESVIGVGSQSMSQRAAELGGCLVRKANELGGTLVSVQLPLGIAAASS